MPYNVICLACTVVAIAFGSIHNLTTRRFVLLDPTKKKGLLAKLKGLLRLSKERETQEQESADEARKETEGEDKTEQDSEDKSKGEGDLRQRKQ